MITLKSKLIIGAIVLTITTGVLTVNKLRTDAFNAGVEACQADAQKALQKAQEANDAQSAGLRATITDYAAKIEKLSNQRQQREQIVVTKIEEVLIDHQPNCEITPELIALRNSIRAQ